MRLTQPFPNLAIGISSFTFPKRNESFRVVTMHAIFILAGLSNEQPFVEIRDGAQNSIAVFASANTAAAGTFTITWHDGSLDSSMGMVSGNLYAAGITDNLWVLPQWELIIGVSSMNAGSRITQIMLQSESYGPAKKGGQRPTMDAA